MERARSCGARRAGYPLGMWKLGLVGLGLAVAACGGSDGGSTGAPLASAKGGSGSGSGGATVTEDAGGLGAGGATVIAKPLCVPGQSVACVGPGACQGGQTCKADGSGYEACECATTAIEDAGSKPSAPFIGPDGQEWLCALSPPSAPFRVCTCETNIEHMRQYATDNDMTVLSGGCPQLVLPCCQKTSAMCQCFESGGAGDTCNDKTTKNCQ